MQRENIEKNPVPTRTKTKTIKKCEDKRLRNYISSESEGNLVETQHVSLTWFISLLMSLLSQIPFFVGESLTETVAIAKMKLIRI